MKSSILIALSLSIAAAACTPRADAVAPVSMTGAYDKMSCSNARKSLDAERQTLATLAKRQNSAATTDAIGVFLILVPVSKLTGGDAAGDLGTSKGKVLALEQRVANCN